MKTNATSRRLLICVTALTAIGALSSPADQALQPQKTDKVHEGLVSAVDVKERKLGVKSLFATKTFYLGDSCTFSFADQSPAAISSLRSGQKVSVRYQDAGGVLIARRVEQEPMRYEGVIKAIDANGHRLVLHRTASDKTLLIAHDCKVLLRDNKSGSLADIRPGHRVTILFDNPAGRPVARQISQTSETYSGVLTAIDAPDRTIKAKQIVGHTKFHLAPSCAIIANGKAGAQLSDLKLGDKLTLNYEEVDGIKIVSRIAEGESTSTPVTTQATR